MWFIFVFLGFDAVNYVIELVMKKQVSLYVPSTGLVSVNNRGKRGLRNFRKAALILEGIAGIEEGIVICGLSFAYLFCVTLDRRGGIASNHVGLISRLLIKICGSGRNVMKREVHCFFLFFFWKKGLHIIWSLEAGPHQ